MTPAAAAQRQRTYRAMGKALRSGVLIRPAGCEHCGGPKPQAHHHWGYEDNEALHVVWLCFACHSMLHATGRCPEVPPPEVREAMRVVIAWSRRPNWQPLVQPDITPIINTTEAAS